MYSLLVLVVFFCFKTRGLEGNSRAGKSNFFLLFIVINISFGILRKLITQLSYT